MVTVQHLASPDAWVKTPCGGGNKVALHSRDPRPGYVRDQRQRPKAACAREEDGWESCHPPCDRVLPLRASSGLTAVHAAVCLRPGRKGSCGFTRLPSVANHPRSLSGKALRRIGSSRDEALGLRAATTAAGAVALRGKFRGVRTPLVGGMRAAAAGIHVGDAGCRQDDAACLGAAVRAFGGLRRRRHRAEAGEAAAVPAGIVVERHLRDPAPAASAPSRRGTFSARRRPA